MRRRLAAGATGLTLAALAAGAPAQNAIEDTFFDGTTHPAIDYAGAPLTDPVQALVRAGGGGIRVTFDPATGYLRGLLQALDIPESSQLAVFSKTSLQSRVISPRTPRTIFFNDTTFVAWPATGFIEIATQDPRQGMVFYALEQQASTPATFIRPSSCLSCHLSYATSNVPGVLARSVATGPGGEGLPQLWNGTTSHRTPLAERWGGWFITGSSGRSAHLGNLTAALDATDPPRARPSTLSRLPASVDGVRYLTPHADLVAQLVFDHQTHLMNLFTRFGWEVRVAMADRPGDVDAVARRAAVDVVDYLLFVGEAAIDGPVSGSSDFAARFTARGPRDSRGRTLRAFDLRTRLFTYRCSYLIYAPVVDALPPAALRALYTRLWHVLSGAAADGRYASFDRDERRTIVEILRETRTGLPPEFQPALVR